MLTGKLVLVIFLLVDTAYVARIIRREARSLRRRMPRWRGPELAFPECAAIAAGADASTTRRRIHERLDRWLDERLARPGTDSKPPDSDHPHKRDAA